MYLVQALWRSPACPADAIFQPGCPLSVSAGISNVQKTTLIMQSPALVRILFGADTCSVRRVRGYCYFSVSRAARGGHTGTVPTQTQDGYLDHHPQERAAPRLWPSNLNRVNVCRHIKVWSHRAFVSVLPKSGFIIIRGK